LPAFVVFSSGKKGPSGGNSNWGSGFLPTVYQGVQFRGGSEPVLFLANPPGIDRQEQADTIAAIGISCPMSRFNASSIAPKVLAAAREASRQLGFRDADPPVFKFRPAEDEQSHSVGSYRRRARQQARKVSHG